jgi:hypothetical protein
MEQENSVHNPVTPVAPMSDSGLRVELTRSSTIRRGAQHQMRAIELGSTRATRVGVK